MDFNKKQKVLLVVTKSNFGGAQRYVYDLATNLSKKGFAVAVTSGGTEGGLIDKLHDANITHIPITNLQRDISMYKEIKSFFSLLNIIRDYDPDIIHLNSSKAGGLGALAARILGVPRIIFTAHGWPFHEKRFIIWRLCAWLSSWFTTLLCHKVIVVSFFDLHHSGMFAIKNKITHIANGIDIIELLSRDQARAKLANLIPDRHEKDFWLHTTAELHANKNLQQVISAVHKYNTNPTNHQKIFYTIAGTGEQKELLEKQIEDLDASSYITLLGYLENSSSYLKAYDGCILISHKEGLPYVLLEAKAASLSIIGSKTGGIPDILKTNAGDILVNPNNPDELQAALATFTRQTEKTTSPFNFTLEKMLSKTVELYTTPQ